MKWLKAWRKRWAHKKAWKIEQNRRNEYWQRYFSGEEIV